MKITNHSQARQGVRTERGLAWIKPGETKEIALSGRGLEQAQRLKFLTIEGGERKSRSKQSDAADELKAVHRGGGTYGIVRGDEPLTLDKLTKEEAEAFNALSADEREADVARRTEPGEGQAGEGAEA